VVVAADDRGGAVGDGGAEHLARMDVDANERPEGDHATRDHAMAYVEVEDDEVLAVGAPDVGHGRENVARGTADADRCLERYRALGLGAHVL
jgi:hypothetical protein